MSNMDISEKGMDFLIRKEGVRFKPYYDTKKLLTIGIGHLLTKPELDTGLIIIGTESVFWRNGINAERVRRLFKQDLAKYINALNDVISVKIDQSKFDALVSVTFNIGVNGMKGSTFIKRLNQGYRSEFVASAMMMWDKPKEIQGRRLSECNLFLTGKYI